VFGMGVHGLRALKSPYCKQTSPGLQSHSSGRDPIIVMADDDATWPSPSWLLAPCEDEGFSGTSGRPEPGRHGA